VVIRGCSAYRFCKELAADTLGADATLMGCTRDTLKHALALQRQRVRSFYHSI
jgi:hypothetical protein